MAVLHIGGGKPIFDGLAQYGLIVDALAVIPDLNDNLAAGLPGGESNLTNGVLARTDAVLDILLDTMVHGVADNVHDGVADAVHNGLVNFRLLTHQRELGLLVELFAHIPHDAVHFLEGGGYGNHAQGHGHILKLIRELAQLTGGFGKLIQAKTLQFRGGGDHGFGDDNLAHHCGELIQLAQVDADQALAVRLGCRLGLGGLPGGSRGRRLFRRGGLMFRGGGWGRLLIDGLVGTHRAGVRDCMDCSIPLCLIPEIERKAGVHDLRRRVGIVLHIGGKVLEAILGAAVADCAHKHECPQVLHAGTLVKEDLESIGEAGDGCRTSAGAAAAPF